MFVEKNLSEAETSVCSIESTERLDLLYKSRLATSMEVKLNVHNLMYGRCSNF